MQVRAPRVGEHTERRGGKAAVLGYEPLSSVVSIKFLDAFHLLVGTVENGK